MIYFIVLIQILYAAAIVYAYRKGVADSYRIYKGEPVKEMPSRKIPPKPPDKEEIIRSNIENYNGSGEGQIDYEL